MTSVPPNSVKIDPLSSLPPELLLLIFDLAYDPEQPLLKPLSKCLLPYFRRNLYRQIRISSLESWSKLLSTVNDSPGLGELVRSFDVSEVFANVRCVPQDVIRPFPRLESIKLGHVTHSASMEANSDLTHISYEHVFVKVIDFGPVTRSHLRSLEISFRDPFGDTPGPDPVPRMERLDKLTLIYCRHQYAAEGWNDGIADHVLDFCPNIAALKLFDSVYPYFRPFLAKISTIASQIMSLELECPSLDSVHSMYSDDILPQFQNLQYLSIGDNIASESLPSHLRQLPLLTSLRLGPSAHYHLIASDFFTLLRGSTRHPSLGHLIFECYGGQRGSRVDVNQDVGEDIEEGMLSDGWLRPVYGDNFDEVDGVELARICATSGIKLEGDATTFWKIEEDYNLEEANRAVLRCLQLESLDEITCGDGSAYFDRISVDDLDPQNLKLVKTGIPEKNWFRLSLE